jgi:two-component system sensor histidine kinase YesM
MKQAKLPIHGSIRYKLVTSFLVMVSIFGLISLSLYYSEQLLLKQINRLLTHNLQIKKFRTDIDQVLTYLEKYLISRDNKMLREYYRYSQVVDTEYSGLTTFKATLSNQLLADNIRNMTRTFLKETDRAIQAKRARDSAEYHQAYMESSRYRTNINWAVDRLITQQLEENSQQYLLISKKLYSTERLGLLLMGGALLFSLIITIWISFRLTYPLQKLAEAAQTITKGNFVLAPLEVAAKDEIGIVTEAFNEMTTSIAGFVQEIKRQTDLEIRLQEQELQYLSMKNTLREAELHALQSQINPHFLFNMLNAGVQLAVIEGSERTGDYIDKVSSLLRYNLRRLDVPVTIAEEAHNLENYFFILKTRYGERRFRFQIQIQPEVSGLRIPLLTLQPIVENALIHGIEDMETGGAIEVSALLQNGLVLIEVRDNGKGMDGKILESLENENQTLGHTTGIGLNNVKERLRIFFGMEELLTIKSVVNQGTTVTINLPFDYKRPEGGNWPI